MTAKGIGPAQRDALRHVAKHEGWQGYDPSYRTATLIRSLANRGLVEMSETTQQFRITDAGRKAVE
jgi:hypothetical protein